MELKLHFWVVKYFFIKRVSVWVHCLLLWAPRGHTVYCFVFSNKLAYHNTVLFLENEFSKHWCIGNQNVCNRLKKMYLFWREKLKNYPGILSHVNAHIAGLAALCHRHLDHVALSGWTKTNYFGFGLTISWWLTLDLINYVLNCSLEQLVVVQNSRWER